MLSVCIPIYNFEVSDLIEGLLEQGSKLPVPFELILIDDCSNEDFKVKNEFSCHKTTYIQLEKNIGRSKIRNLFLQYTKYEYLLFLDCDAKLASISYLENYITLLKNKNHEVIFGGSIYEKELTDKKCLLNWKYGLNRQQNSAETRRINQYHSFMTNNFLINKKTFEKIKFNEKIANYGHEDTLFGLELKKKDIPIYHSNNSVYHIGLDINCIFIEKTETAIKSLLHIQNEIENSKVFRESIKLISTYEKIKRLNILFLFNFAFKLSRKSIKNHFLKGNANLYFFDFYKLGFYIHELKNQSK